MAIKVLIADDHKMFRDGLRTLLQRHSGVEVIAEAEDGLQALKLVEEKDPDVVIMDISMPELNGIETTRKISSDFPNTKVVMLSMHSDRRFVVEALKAGAAGYLLKDSAFEELVQVIQKVQNDQVYLSSKINDIILKEYIQMVKRGGASAFTVLSPREREVLQLLAEGKSTRQIADLLKVSIKTIETHRKQIMDKLEIRSVAELTKYAIREGLTALDL